MQPRPEFLGRIRGQQGAPPRHNSRFGSDDFQEAARIREGVQDNHEEAETCDREKGGEKGRNREKQRTTESNRRTGKTRKTEKNREK